jgi:hypothetical protein
MSFRTLTTMVAMGLLIPSAFAVRIIDKLPDRGPFWNPLGGPGGTYVYTSDFVFTGGSNNLVTGLGVYMLRQGSGNGTNFRFELWGDNGTAPDPSQVLAVTNYTSVSNQSLQLVELNTTTQATLVAGRRYWVVASTVGQQSVGSYQVGAHTQNSIYNDNGTFWYSNDPNGINFDGRRLTPQMAITVNAVPEPASMLVLGGALAALAARRRRK